MSLFSSNDITNKNVPDVSDERFGVFVDSIGKLKCTIGKVKKNLDADIGNITGIQLIDFTTMGRWSMHHLLFYLLNQTGPASVYFTTWAISNKAVFMLTEALQKNLITELHSILDRRIRIRRSDNLAFLQSNANSVYLIDCHAKVLLIENKNFQITVKGSANFTENKRIESGVIMQHPEIFRTNKFWITETIKDLKPFE